MMQLVFILFSILAISCGNPGKNAGNTVLAKPDSVMESKENLLADRLVGTWKSTNGKIFERWTKTSTGSYQSSVFRIKGHDTIFMEQASVYRIPGGWVFINRVKDQNEGKEIRFTSLSESSSSIHFNNPEHDFPTDIYYTMPDDSTVHAFIAGPNKKGGRDTIPFNYVRVKD
jgi:hypothetical protein